MTKFKRIAVLGSSGFIGNHLVNRLSMDPNIDIICIDLESGIDFTNKEMVDAIPEFDIFIYLGGISFIPASYNRPGDFYRTNFLLTLHALELCRKYKAPIIMSSSYVYGFPDYLPIDEMHPVGAINPYMQTKLLSELLCEGYHRDFQVNCIIFRPFNIYGPGQNSNFLIPSIINQLKSLPKDIELQNPHSRRDFVYVADYCDAIQNALMSDIKGYDVFNIASGQSYSVAEIAKIIIEEAGMKDIDVRYKQNGLRKGDVMDVCGSNKKIYELIGWKPRLALREGLKRTIQSVIDK